MNTARPPTPSANDSVFEEEVARSDLPREAHGVAYEIYVRHLSDLQGADEVEMRSAATIAIVSARSEQFAEEESDRFAGGGSREDALGPYIDRPVWFTADDDDKEAFVHGLLSNQLQKLEGEDPRELALHAMDLARERFDGKHRVYLSWLWLRYEGQTAKEIADEEQKRGGTTKPATVRSGWRRANDRLLDIIHELRFHRHAHLSGDVDPRLRAIEKLLDVPEHLAEAEARLAGLREEYSRDPQWHILMGKVKRRQNNTMEALEAYREACVWARNDTVRGEAHNAMGYAYDKAGNRVEAVAHYRMSTELAPALQKPWMNLMADASLHKDLAEAKRLIQRFTEVVHSGKMSASDREEALTTLSNKADPELRWIRAQDEWRRVYATWLKKLAAVAAAAVILFALLRGASAVNEENTTVAAKGEEPARMEAGLPGNDDLVAAKGEVFTLRGLAYAKGERQT